MLFGRKPKEKTILLLDVENGSVGSALVRLSSTTPPKLFGEWRTHIPAGSTVSGSRLARDIEHAAQEALLHASQVAARLRGHAATADIGTPERAALFLSPPWGKPNLVAGKPDFLNSMAAALRKSLGSVIEGPSHFYTAAGALAHGSRLLEQEPVLLCTVTGEVTELLLVDGKVLAQATIPLGTHGLIRTLRTHAGLSEEEARSAIQLPFATARLRDPFAAASAHFAEHFTDAARDLFSIAAPARVRVAARSGAGEWYAKALARNEDVAALFPRGGEVRALRPQHLTSLLAGHAASPDLFLTLEALFVDSSRDTQVR